MQSPSQSNVHFSLVSDEGLWSCSWSSDGKALAVAGNDRVIRLFAIDKDSALPAKKVELKGAHEKSIRALSFCPRRKRLAAASFDGTVSIWQARRGESILSAWDCIASLEGHENEVKAVGWAAFLGADEDEDEEQLRLATCGRDKTVWVWAVDQSFASSHDEEEEDLDFECLAVLQEHEQDIKCVAWHPTLPIFLTGSYDESVRLWGPAPEALKSLDDWGCFGRIRLAGDFGTIWSVAFAHHGQKAAVATASGNLLIFNVPHEYNVAEKWALERVIVLFKAVQISLGTEQDSEGCSGKQTSKGGCCGDDSDDDGFEHPNSSTEEGCCGGGSGSGSGERDSCCKSSKAPQSQSLSIPGSELYSVAWNCSGTLIAVGTSSNRVAVLETSNWNVEACLWIEGHAGEVNAVAWSPKDPNLLASVADDGTLLLHRIN